MITDYSLKYVNSFGDVLDLTGGANYAHYMELPAWEMETLTLNGRISDLRRSQNEFTIPVNILGNGNAEGVAARNALYEIPALDVVSKTPGKLYFNDWYLQGYMTASKPDNFWQSKHLAQYELKFVASDASWTRETETPFTANAQVSGAKDYPHDYAFDFASSRSVSNIANENFIPSYIRLDIQGPATNPTVFIGGNRYKVDVTVGVNERLVIDGLAKTIEIVDLYGNRTNVFSKRAGSQVVGGGEYVFEKLNPGTSPVVWEGLDAFSVTVYEQRAEPRWA